MALEKIKKMFGDEDGTTGVDESSYYNINDGQENSAGVVSNQMILAEPRAYSESQTIADQLKARNTVVVNLKRVTEAQSKRITDFLTGTLYAIGGDLQKIGPGIYLCTPQNVTVQGKISDPDEEKTKNKNEDKDNDW